MPKSDFISEIYEVQFGEPLDPQKVSRLRKSMLDYRLWLLRSGEKKIVSAPPSMVGYHLPVGAFRESKCAQIFAWLLIVDGPWWPYS